MEQTVNLTMNSMHELAGRTYSRDMAKDTVNTEEVMNQHMIKRKVEVDRVDT